LVARPARNGVAIVDPLADTLARRGATGDVDAFLALDGVFGALAGDPRFTTALRAAHAALTPATPDAVRHALAS
jgi:fructuronate reductase